MAAGVGSQYAMMPSRNKKLLVVDGKCVVNKAPSSRSFSTTTFVGNVFQKLFNILKPTEIPLTALEKNKQSLSAPDIFVDMSLSTPVFDPGKTTLIIPEDQEATCDQISLSVGNSPVDWCPTEKIEKHTYSWKYRNTAAAGFEMPCSSSKYKRPKAQKSFNHLSKSKTVGKNQNEKNRHDLLADMLEDYPQIPNENEFESEDEGFESVMNKSCEVDHNLNLVSSQPSSSTVPFNLSEESFPAIGFPVSEKTKVQHLLGQHLRQTSECESEDSFVIFSEDVRLLTPSANPRRRNDICMALNNFFAPVASLRRERNLSECSDDSIVFCYDSNHDDTDCQLEIDLDTDDDGSEDESYGEGTDKARTHQLDSGFEEKKVRFNLNPEVHEIRAWEFAYRHARKGEWEMAARDRERFRKRIEETEHILKPVLECSLRDRVYHERFSS
ncbi:uncharacterized protein LOC131692031 isoform X2 [Topomyia yanbarensis]|nr:uncharacterized protein LOC131692031 isoform X2 [Topomyia yanbarensis]